MTVQWPSEQAYNEREDTTDFVNFYDELQHLLDSYLPFPDHFNEIVTKITQQDIDITTFEEEITHLSQTLELSDFPNGVNLLMTWACAEALAKTPLRLTWKRVSKLKYFSGKIEQWLYDILILYIEKNPDAKTAYIKISTAILKNFDRKRQGIENITLDSLFRGIYSVEEFPLFKLLSVLNLEKFIHIVSKSKNPILVNSALMSAGIYCSFKSWQEFILSSSITFSNDGTWNQSSVTIPLLLAIARDQLLLANNNLPYHDASDAELEEVKNNITNISVAIIETLSKREDALALFSRWSTWLMRQLLIQGMKDIENIRSSAYVDNCLIEAIGKKIKEKDIVKTLSSDAAPWEFWIYRIVLISYAKDGQIKCPESQSFLKEWKLKFDDWPDEQGKQLRERAKLCVSFNLGFPGDIAHFLAYSIVMSPSPETTWINLWNSTFLLREIIEFGDFDTNPSEEYRSSNKVHTNELLLLLFCIGLAILDQRIDVNLSVESVENLSKLHKTLFNAVREMREIDNAFGAEKWFQAMQHLAVRRLIWEQRSSTTEQEEQFTLFLPTAKPTFSDYLNETKNDVQEFLTLLQIVWLNEDDKELIKQKIKEADINLSQQIDTITQLKDISERHYKVDENFLELLQQIK